MSDMKKNVVLIGFMGTGKSSTGKVLAARLGFSFIDMDTYIETKENRKIPEIFATDGEAYFRSAEREAVKELSERRHIVIATGGGTLKSEENRQILRENGVVVCLTADVDTILERTRRPGVRPVLDGKDDGDRRAAICSLLEERKEMYSQADLFVDTSERSPLQIVDEIVHYLKREGHKLCGR
ncbi:MAG: shikimate kinase [Schwartzia sp.]|nr:shikimate kinase [Schwartzia sp. (in: firmicutes)]